MLCMCIVTRDALIRLGLYFEQWGISGSGLVTKKTKTAVPDLL